MDLRLADHYTTRQKEGLRCTKIKLSINRIIDLNYHQFEDGDRLFTDFRSWQFKSLAVRN